MINKSKHMVAVVSTLLILIILIITTILYTRRKNTDNIMSPEITITMSNEQLNSLMNGYYIHQVFEVWGVPTTNSDDIYIWKIGDKSIRFTTNKNEKIIKSELF